MKEVPNLTIIGPTNPIQILNQHNFFLRFCMCPSNDTFNKKKWNSTQNILSIHWKIWFLYNIENLITLRFMSPDMHFLHPHPTPQQSISLTPFQLQLKFDEILFLYNSIPGYCTMFFTCYNNTAAIACDQQFKNINWTCNVQHGLMCYFNLLQVSFNRIDIDFLLCGIGKVEDGLSGPWFSTKNIIDAILPEKEIPLWRFPSQRASYVESVSISWHHHVLRLFPCMGLLPDT